MILYYRSSIETVISYKQSTAECGLWARKNQQKGLFKQKNNVSAPCFWMDDNDDDEDGDDDDFDEDGDCDDGVDYDLVL